MLPGKIFENTCSGMASGSYFRPLQTDESVVSRPPPASRLSTRTKWSLLSLFFQNHFLCCFLETSHGAFYFALLKSTMKPKINGSNGC